MQKKRYTPYPYQRFQHSIVYHLFAPILWEQGSLRGLVSYSLGMAKLRLFTMSCFEKMPWQFMSSFMLCSSLWLVVVLKIGWFQSFKHHPGDTSSQNSSQLLSVMPLFSVEMKKKISFPKPRMNLGIFHRWQVTASMKCFSGVWIINIAIGYKL